MITLFLCLCGTASFAQTTNIAIGTTTVQPSVRRFGINLGTLNNYDSGQMTQNLLLQNPGFEGQIWNSIINCMSGSATTCVDSNQWAAWPAGFWNGATFEVFYGAAAGRTGTVTTSTAPNLGQSQGITLNFSGSGPALANGTYLIVRKKVPGGAAQGWWPSTYGQGSIGDNLTDLPPGTLGQQTVVLKAPSAADSASISGYFDSTIGKTFVQLNGTYQLQFKAKGIGGSNQIAVHASRSGVATYLDQTVTLSGAWNTYNLTFSATENGTAVGGAGVTFSTQGADAFELDDVSLTKISGDPTNTTVFRDPVVTALRTLQPGSIRFWGGQLGETLDNLLTPQFGRQRAGYSAWATEVDAIDYGLHDFLVLCQTVGADPWIVVPTTFNTTDATNLIEYLGSATSTTYGAKRAALGQSTPWTQVFHKIHLEFGNEPWDQTFRGASIEDAAPNGQRAQTIFGVMRADASYVPAVFDLVLNGQAVWPGRNVDIQNNCNNNDSFSMAPYTMQQVDSFSTTELLYGSTFAEPEAYMSSTGSAEGLTPGLVYQEQQALQGTSHPVPLSFNEFNLSPTVGSITQQVLSTYPASLGAGLMVADTMLLSLKDYGILDQELFALPQYQFTRTDGSVVPLWGSVVDMGVTDRKRPQFLAVQLANQALSYGATMLQTVHSGADPTWDQPLVNTVQLNGAHELQSFAFSQGSNRSLVVFNLSRTSALPVTFSGANAPTGLVQMQQLTSANPSDNNETANVVNITPSTIASFNPSSGLSLPPYSMTVLTWTPGAPANPAPVISAVKVTNTTTSTATITWTTDQAATSQVNYGTTTAYGSASTLNTTPVMSHTVTLTGLAAGTTYDYDVVSAVGTSSATSANFTFVTANVPVMSSASYTGADTTTQGMWAPSYGNDGSIIANDANNPPSYATVSLTGASTWTWTTNTTDPRALQISSGSSSRISSTYYSPNGFTIDVNLTDGNTHKVSLYLCDWDSGSRVETVTIVDAASQTVLSTQNVSSFTNGVYESWNISGHVQMKIIYGGGINAIVNAIFFDTTGSTPVPVPVVKLSASSLTFGSQVVGTSASQTLTVTNTGNATLSIGSVQLGGANVADFSFTNACGTTLAASASCNISVSFNPAATGLLTASLSINDNAAGSPHTVALSGTGTSSTPVPTPTTFTTYLGPYGSGVQTITGASVVLPLRAYNPAGATQIAYVETALNSSSTGTNEFSIFAESNGSGGYTLLVDAANGTASSPLTLIASGATVTLATPITLGSLQITAYQFALAGNELQLNLTVTRSGTFSDQIVIYAVSTANAYSSPWGVVDGSWN